jgi:hypothetical protein
MKDICFFRSWFWIVELICKVSVHFCTVVKQSEEGTFGLQARLRLSPYFLPFLHAFCTQHTVFYALTFLDECGIFVS